ncbi:hypothetical protein PV327_010501 [Microctonus hyperodae]|uniref:Dynein regulatory complex subunit 2 n=1 Tax=Microctonus hyperodae TaxID=165561 RepID=A0AA39FSF4_MICHY|nr:hypothetical protein PV327_010501 [Microctonus hyperodae]
MPPKKKKGKGSKLARMSEEEKLRYLQHRAEIELEAKRRKQQLIAAFTKNKLKREEAFARLNLAKINEQWRFHLRQLKCKELYDNLEYLWKYFDTALRAKTALIDQLYEKLNTADIDHRKLQSSHIKMIDKFINNHRLRLDKLHQYYEKSLMEIKIDELNEMNCAENLLKESCKHIEIICYAENIFIENKLMKTKIRNAINTNTIEYSKMEDKLFIEKEIGNKIEDLWLELNNIIMDYQKKTDDKRKHYDILVEQDLMYQHEAARFPGLQSQLIHTIESLKYHENILTITRDKTVSELLNEIEMSNKQIYKLRQDILMNQTVNEIQLKRQTIISGSVIEYLKKLKQKSASLMMLMKMCSNYEHLFVIINKYSNYCGENSNEENIYCVMNPYDKLENFWQQYNYIKTENYLIKTDYNQLVVENKKLRDSLRAYLVAIARVPNTNSTNYNLI